MEVYLPLSISDLLKAKHSKPSEVCRYVYKRSWADQSCKRDGTSPALPILSYFCYMPWIFFQASCVYLCDDTHVELGPPSAKFIDLQLRSSIEILSFQATRSAMIVKLWNEKNLTLDLAHGPFRQGPSISRHWNVTFWAECFLHSLLLLFAGNGS